MDAEASRERILNAAEKLFAESGFDGTPTARIADLAGIPKGLLFYYFPKKIDLLLTLVKERILDRPWHQPPQIVRGNVAATLCAIAAADAESQVDSDDLAVIVQREAETHEEVRRCLAGIHDETVQHVRDAIDAALSERRKSVPTRVRDAASLTFACALLHARSVRRHAGERLDLSTVANLVAAGMSP